MPLFVATHRHPAETCPASPNSGAQLLSNLSASNAARYGVLIQSEAVIDGEHRLILVLEASDRSKIECFLSFLTPFGSVELLSASSSESAIARGACGNVHPPDV
jgi:hypothetical protein